MVTAHYDVTDLVAARRRTRPPTWLFVVGLACGWVLDVVFVVFLVRIGLGLVVVIPAAVLGYLLLPVPFVTVLRRVWLTRHRDVQEAFGRELDGAVERFRGWVDARVGEPIGLPPELAARWLLRPEPAGVVELLRLSSTGAWRVGGPALAARHVRTDGRTEVRLLVVPDADVLTDGPEPPLPA